MIIEDAKGVTPAVVKALEATTHPRAKQIMEALVRHAHAFAQEVQLTEEEFEYGLEFLNRIGQTTNETHNEAILFADTIGLSTLVCLMNNGQNGATETAAALLGPFWRMHAPKTANGGSIVRSPTPGPVLFAQCKIMDQDGKPITGVAVDVWQSSPVGLYENQDEAQTDMNLRGQFITDSEGCFSFRSVKPAGYPIPLHGPVGDMIRVQNRRHYRPAHIHFLCFKEGFKTLVTQVFVDDDKDLQNDVVFGVTRALIGDFKKQEGPAPAADVTGPWYSLDYTFVMERGVAKLPHPPIK
jgi:protocatechuate 3,4-dioxygenase beta subunit